MMEKNEAGIFKNIIGAIISPKETLERVNENPKIWGYLIPITLIQLIAAIIGLPKLISYTILKAQEVPNFSQALVPTMRTGVIIFTLVVTLITPALFILVSTLFIKIVASIFKETGDFKKLYCVNTLAYVPILISAILTGIIMCFTEPQNVKNVSTSFALFLSSSIDIKSTIYKLFSAIDFFYIWSCVLSVIGSSIVFKMNIKKATIIVFGIYIVSIIVRVLV